MLMLNMIFLVLSELIPKTHSFANMMTRSYCNKQLEEGVMIMGTNATYDSNRNLKLLRGESEIVKNGSFYISAEKLRLVLEPKSFQMVIEVDSSDENCFPYFENEIESCNRSR